MKSEYFVLFPNDICSCLQSFVIQPLCLLILHFWNEHLKRVFVNPRQKISTDKSKQTSTFLE